MAAFHRAVELGADGVELDLHRTADGELVVHHDAALADGRAITALVVDALERVRVRGEPIPLLAEVFEAVGDRVAVHCELKGSDTAKDALALISRHRAAGATVHAFDHRLIAAARALAPAVPRGVLEVSYPVEPLAAARAVDARDLWRQWELIDQSLIDLAHADGRRVVAWTVNDAVVMTRLANWGVDGLCTDDVALATRTLGR